jgi:hypothetical protein
MKTKNYLTAGILLVLTILLTSGVYAFAISTPYWPENPLKIAPGQTVDLQLVLKNNAGASPAILSAEVSQGADITTITDSNKVYNVPAGGEAAMNVRVSVPSDSKIGGNYPVEFTFKTMQSGLTGGAVGIGSSISTRLPVFVVNEEESMVPVVKTNWTLYLIIGVAVLVMVVIVVALNKRKKQE